MNPSLPTLGPSFGILGGMGPLAAVDLQAKIVLATPVTCDQDHVPVICHNVAQIPDRQAFLRGAGPSPVPAMVLGLERLCRVGAALIAIPCNTAHIWYDELAAACPVPILHIADVAVAGLATRAPGARRIGIVATPATVSSGLYRSRLEAAGYTALDNTPAELEEFFNPGCAAVKANRVEEGGALFEKAAQCLMDRGAEWLILACTEVPVGFDAIRTPLAARSLDATTTLAERAIQWWQHERARVIRDA